MIVRLHIHFWPSGLREALFRLLLTKPLHFYLIDQIRERNLNDITHMLEFQLSFARGLFVELNNAVNGAI